MDLIRMTDYEKWMYLLPKKDLNDHIFIKLNNKCVKNLLKISKCSLVLNKISAIHQDEYDEIKEYLSKFFVNSTKPYFLKLNSCSPKDSPFGIKINIVDNIILSLVTSKRCNVSFNKDKDHYIILKPWREDIDIKREFRVFVYDSKITSLSQYHWYESCQLDKLDLNEIFKKIQQFCNDIINKVNFKSSIFKTNSFVIDVHITNNDNIELIEINPWGPSGSCLFEWKRDFDQLFGKTDHTEFRILVD